MSQPTWKTEKKINKLAHKANLKVIKEEVRINNPYEFDIFYNNNSCNYQLSDIPLAYRNQRVCNKLSKTQDGAMAFVPRELITRQMCMNALKRSAFNLLYIPKELLDEEMMLWLECYNKPEMNELNKTNHITIPTLQGDLIYKVGGKLFSQGEREFRATIVEIELIRKSPYLGKQYDFKLTYQVPTGEINSREMTWSKQFPMMLNYLKEDIVNDFVFPNYLYPVEANNLLTTRELFTAISEKR